MERFGKRKEQTDSKEKLVIFWSFGKELMMF